MKLPLQPPLAPMEAEIVDALPAEAEGWQYEPKWDGFRCIAFRENADVYLQSKAGRPLGRFFPDMVQALLALPAPRFVIDGELVIPVAGGTSFEELQLRLHPAASRVAKLAAARPAGCFVFDLLVDAEGELCADEPLALRRRRLEAFAAQHFGGVPVDLSPATRERAVAQSWLASPRGGVDGVMAKRLDQPYRPGDRSAMRKIKPVRTVDCVVGGYREGGYDGRLGSLLLGLYDDERRLHHVGHTSSLDAAQRRAWTSELALLLPRPGESAGFANGGPDTTSRWSAGRSTAWIPLRPERVVEVEYRHFTGGRFRHGTNLRRSRPDKEPHQCTFAQIPPHLRGRT